MQHWLSLGDDEITMYDHRLPHAHALNPTRYVQGARVHDVIVHGRMAGRPVAQGCSVFRLIYDLTRVRVSVRRNLRTQG